jgi:hypothetical protein
MRKAKTMRMMKTPSIQRIRRRKGLGPRSGGVGPSGGVGASATTSGSPTDSFAGALTQFGAEKTRLALVPPKPNEFDSTLRILRGLACLGARSMSQPSDGLSRFKVGGAT